MHQGAKNLIKQLFSKGNDKLILFKSLNINFDLIGKLNVSYSNDIKTKKTPENFYKYILTSFNNKNNLVYLNLKIEGIYDYIDVINEFKSLKYLYLKGFNYYNQPIKELIINLPNLEEVSLRGCSTIIFGENIYPNMKFLEIRSALRQKELIEFPKLKEFIFKNCRPDFVNFYSLKQ